MVQNPVKEATPNNCPEGVEKTSLTTLAAGA